MGIIIAKGKSLKLKKALGTATGDYDMITIKDAFEEIEGATATMGRVKVEKGINVFESFYTNYDEFQHITSGSKIMESEGKVHVIHEGDFVHVQKGTTVTLRETEGFEAIVITVPPLKALGHLPEPD